MPGLALSRLFYEEAVAPILAHRFPGLTHAAGRLDTGSEVLGFDTPRSMDHWWGPRVTVFLRSEDFTAQLADEIKQAMGNELPLEVGGFPTHMHEIDVANNTVIMARTDQRPINHMVTVTTARDFFGSYLGVQPLDGLTPRDWLAIPEQNLRTVASGGVWHDGPGEVTRARETLRWYPDDVWRYLLAAQWRRIEQEEAFPGRCAEVGDELGSRVVAARLVREVMHLAFLLERQYMPYSKWLGTAFSRLAVRQRPGARAARRAGRQRLAGAAAAAERGLRDGRADAQRARPERTGRGHRLALPRAPVSGHPRRPLRGGPARGDHRRSSQAVAAKSGQYDAVGDSTDLMHARWFGRLRALYDRAT